MKQLSDSEIHAAVARALKTVGEQIREQDERAEILAEVERVWQARKAAAAEYALHEASSPPISPPQAQ